MQHKGSNENFLNFINVCPGFPGEDEGDEERWDFLHKPSQCGGNTTNYNKNVQ